MSFRINTNVAAMNALRNVGQTGTSFNQSITRLSTGLRINSAADDPAGLIISENFRAQINGIDAALRNSQDAVNYAKTAEGGSRADLAMDLKREIRSLQLTRPPGTSARSMRHEPADAMFLSVLEAGPVILDTANQCLVQNTGDIVLWNADQRHEWRYEQGMSSTCVRLPRSWLSRMVPDLPASRLLPAGGPATGLLACMVRQLAALPSPHGTKAGAHLRSSLLHVLFATLSSGPCAEPSRLADAKQYMRARLDDTELTLQQVASSLGISLRSLARLFADEGSTPSRWLWSERVDQAHRLLESGEAQRVTDAALACGFTSFSHFSRAFRQAHGVPPSAVLNRAGG